VPGLYVTANLYLPKKAKLPAPAVLYVCGHAGAVVDRIPYGSKVNYQHHPTWFASHGYVCLILDTLQLGEVPGLHHGTYRHRLWWWQALGYTPAGIECWNAMRALDYLQSRKEVDPKRLGITGRSGGGATSWWVGAADERVRCIVPVAGIADLLAHVSEGYPGRFRDGVISGHCDCMYFQNTYRWDFTQVMALCAPRPVLLGNSDRDDIFPVPGYRRLAARVKRLYELYGAGDRFALLETSGPHKDTPELRRGAFRWLNHWLKGEPGEVTDAELPRLRPQQLKVLARVPADSLNDVIHQRFLRPARVELPEAPAVAREWWKGKAPQWRRALREKVFRGWPERPPALNARLAAEVRHDGVRLRAYDFVSEEGIELRLWVLTGEKGAKPAAVVLSAVEEGVWQLLLMSLGPAFKGALCGKGNPPPSPYPARHEAQFGRLRRWLEHSSAAVVAPRGVGPTRWSEVSPYTGRPAAQHILRRFALLGQTLDGQRVWDVRRAVAALRSVPDLKDVPLTLEGRGAMAGVVLYAALFEPSVAELELWGTPTSHREGPIFLNVLRVLDMPQAVALAFPRRVRLYVRHAGEVKAWDWPVRLQKALGKEYLQVRRSGE
jgi:hypothetical protein